MMGLLPILNKYSWNGYLLWNWLEVDLVALHDTVNPVDVVGHTSHHIWVVCAPISIGDNTNLHPLVSSPAHQGASTVALKIQTYILWIVGKWEDYNGQDRQARLTRIEVKWWSILELGLLCAFTIWLAIFISCTIVYSTFWGLVDIVFSCVVPLNKSLFPTLGSVWKIPLWRDENKEQGLIRSQYSFLTSGGDEVQSIRVQLEYPSLPKNPDWCLLSRRVSAVSEETLQLIVKGLQHYCPLPFNGILEVPKL
jgi:hypothetical protein